MLRPHSYEIQVEGYLGHSWSDWLQGMVICHQDDGTTVLQGTVPDQAALHGILSKIRDLGLPLVMVTRIEGDENGNKPGE